MTLPPTSMAAAALRWVLDHPQVSAAIPGFKDVRQVAQNLAAAQVPSFDAAEVERLAAFFEQRVRPHVRGSL